MKPRSLALSLVAIASLAGFGPWVPPPTAPVPMEGLAAMFELGPVLQDRNGDEQADFVAARPARNDAALVCSRFIASRRLRRMDRPR